jgi:hypothetical protein
MEVTEFTEVEEIEGETDQIILARIGTPLVPLRVKPGNISHLLLGDIGTLSHDELEEEIGAVGEDLSEHTGDGAIHCSQPAIYAALTLENSWVNYGSPYQVAGVSRNNFGRVFLEGLVKDGTYSDGTTITTLAEAYRPAVSRTVRFVPYMSGSTRLVAHLIVWDTGEIKLYGATGNTWLSLSIDFEGA